MPVSRSLLPERSVFYQRAQALDDHEEASTVAPWKGRLAEVTQGCRELLADMTGA